MKKVLVICAALALAGCNTVSNVGNAISVVTAAKVSPQAALVAANSFNALEVTATAYLQLPKCPASVACKTDTAVKAIVPAVRSGRAARNEIESLLKANGGSAIPVVNYNTLTSANNVLQTIYNQYNIQR